ncbi:hypothetical protein ABW19_dt0209004 [Dactylella cylindrospora]|nr:hypothetical protein ABW19_dt0209004 [Dactylella cylindrospora]
MNPRWQLREKSAIAYRVDLLRNNCLTYRSYSPKVIIKKKRLSPSRTVVMVSKEGVNLSERKPNHPMETLIRPSETPGRQRLCVHLYSGATELFSALTTPSHFLPHPGLY